MVQCVKAHTAMPDDPSFILGIHMIEGEVQLFQDVSDLHVCVVACTYPRTCT